MTNILVALGALCGVAAFGCTQTNPGETDSMRRATEKSESDSIAQRTGADNTAVNERDEDTETLTPGDQGENERDLTITQHARQEIMDAEAVSFTGKNVKIITLDGVVTLRGPVKNAREKTEIATLVGKVAGVKRVDNQLEIAAE